MRRLKEAMLLLVANDAPLGPEWLDHPLKGEWDGNRECQTSAATFYSSIVWLTFRQRV
jgi:mRNA-degrading endonuclease YafQ of YafQ-DinJ toxin-antitoxin module